MKLPVHIYASITETRDSYFQTYFIFDDNDEELCETNDSEKAEAIAQALNQQYSLKTA